MSEPEEQELDLGGLIADAAEANDSVAASQVIRGGEFILLQQIDMETGAVEEDEEGNFSVVLAEVEEDDIAVVCFTNATAAANFSKEISEDLPEGHSLPEVILDGDTLLDGLPEDCGLLVNPGTENECYFPPGCFYSEE